MTNAESSSELKQVARDEIDFVAVLAVLKGGLPKLVIAVLICMILAVAYVIFATKWYRAEVVMIFTEEQSIPSLGGQLGGLAAFAGVSLGTSSIETEALAVLRSRDFARRFIKGQNLADVYVDSEPALLGRLIRRGAKDADAHLEEAVAVFQRKVLRVAQDPKTGVVTIMVQWPDQDVVATWANGLAESVNAQLRQQALSTAEDNMAYLREQLAETSLVDLQQSISRLLEVEMQKLMLARGNAEFAFKIVDYAVRPVKPSRPNAPFVLSFALAFGLVIGSLIVFLTNGTSIPARS